MSVCIVRSYDKKTGVTYVYKSESSWDPVTKMPRPKRTCIGKIDPVTGEIVPTGKRGRPKKENSQPENDDSSAASRIENLENQVQELTKLVEQQQAEHTLLTARLESYDSKMRKVISTIDGLGETLSALHNACEDVLK